MSPAPRPSTAAYLALVAGVGAGLVVLVAVLRNSAPASPAGLEAARDAYARGDHAAAYRLYKGRIPATADALEDHRCYQNSARKLAKSNPALFEAVKGEYEALRVRQPGQAWVHYLRARLEDGEAFQREMKIALDADPGFLPALYGCANEAFESGRLDAAAEHFERAWAKGGRDHVDRHLVALYRIGRHEGLDRLIEHLRGSPPGEGVSLVAYPLDSGSPAAALLVGYGSGTPYLWALQFVRGDNATRLFSVAKDAAEWTVHGTEEWTIHKPDELPVNGPVLLRSATNPGFAAVLAEAKRRLHDGKKEGG